MAIQFQFRRDTEANWTAKNPILADGEPAYTTDTKPYKKKIGDGVSTWTALPYEGYGITVGQTHGDYRQQDGISDIEVHEPIDLTFDPDDKKSVALAINPNAYAAKTDFDTVKTEVERLKTDTSASSLEIYSWRGKDLPVVDNSKPYKAYYLHCIVLKDSLGVITLPSNAPNDAIFSIENNDRDDFVTLAPPVGETINGAANTFKCDSDTLNFFVKDGTDWNLAYGGVFPNSMQSLKSTIQTFFPNSLFTIPDVEAQLKDRLHTFSEIQSEFSNQLHTEGEIELISQITFSDDKGNSFIGERDVEFKKSTLAKNGNVLEITPDEGAGEGITFTDGQTGTNFKATKIQSVDKSIRISNLNGVADLAKGYNARNEWIVARLGHDNLLDSRRKNIRLGFEDVYSGGGFAIYEDKQKKSFVVQDVNPSDDPNVSGGTSILVLMYITPDDVSTNSISSDGRISLKLTDNDNNVILDEYGNPMIVYLDYKSGDKQRGELYSGMLKAKAFTDVHMAIELDFSGNEFISVGDDTCICLEAVLDSHFYGDGLSKFEEITGQKINFEQLYFGYNYINLAKDLVYNEAMETNFTGKLNLGQGLKFNAETPVDIEIENYFWHMQGNGIDLPVCNFYKMCSELDTKLMGGKNVIIKCKLKNSQDDFDIALLEYNKDFNPPDPKIIRYDTGGSIPVFADGWSKIDTLVIDFQGDGLEHIEQKIFLFPDSSKYIAIVAYPRASKLNMDLYLGDIEMDIALEFTFVNIKSMLSYKEYFSYFRKENYLAATYTPNGAAGYRYTINSTETKIPFGIVSGGDGKIINAHDWADAGSYDPDKVQGDGQLKTNGILTIKDFGIRAFNEKNLDSDAELYLVDASGVEIPNSKVAKTVLSDSTQNPTNISFNPSLDESKFIKINALAGEKIGLRAKTNQPDGFYIQSGTDGKPLSYIKFEFDEITAEEQNMLDTLSLMDDELIITQDALNAKCYIELDFKSGKPVITAKQR